MTTEFAGMDVAKSRDAKAIREKRSFNDIFRKVCADFVVKAYKIAGLVILLVILTGMAAYLSASGFYLFSRNWAVPAVLTPGNDKVIAAQLSFLDKSNELNKIDAERMTLTEQLRVAELAIAASTEFVDSFSAALDAEGSQVKKKLTAVEGLVHAMAKGADAADDTGSLTLARLDENLKAGLIDLDEYGRLKNLLLRSNLQTAENNGRMVELQQQAKNLRKLVKTGVNADVDSLLRQRPLVDAEIALAREEAQKIILTTRLRQLNPIYESYKTVVDSMSANPYVKASTGEISIAFIPYENLHDVSKGTPVFSCALEFVFCRRAGDVVAILEGEVASRHPVSGKEIRGKMVELDLKSIASAQRKSLILKQPPFFF